MARAQDAMRDSLWNARVENQYHRLLVDSAVSLVAVGSELRRHETVMNEAMTALDDAMTDLQGCSGDGMPQMLGLRGQLAEEMNGHHAATGRSADLAAARGETERHAAAMGSMLEQMEQTTECMSCHVD
jgi:hypothetical protein